MNDIQAPPPFQSLYCHLLKNNIGWIYHFLMYYFHVELYWVRIRKAISLDPWMDNLITILKTIIGKYCISNQASSEGVKSLNF
jgi:hypothetical protein